MLYNIKIKKRKKGQEKMNTRIHLIYIYAREAQKKRKEWSKALSGQGRIYSQAGELKRKEGKEKRRGTPLQFSTRHLQIS